jgi:hypothetical protein
MKGTPMYIRNLTILPIAAFSVSLLVNACMLGGGGEGCYAEPVSPIDVTAMVNGEGEVGVIWSLSSLEIPGLHSVQAHVQYAAAGGAGEQCSTYTPAEGCVRGCEPGNGNFCTITGLTSGVSYTFTVITNSIPTSPYCGFGIAYDRSEPVTPGAN